MFDVYVERFQIQFMMGIESKYQVTPQVMQRFADAKLVGYSASRRLVSEAIAEDLDKNDNWLRINTVRGLDRPHEGYRPLSDWARAKSIAVSYDPDQCSATLALASKKVKIALACDRAYVGDIKFDLGKFVICKDGVWMVPAERLGQALGLPK